MARIGFGAGWPALAAGIGLLAWTGTAQGQAMDGAQLYQTKTCIACHGKDAKTPLLPDYPKLAGQNKDYLYRQMLDIKSGARANGNTAAMKGVMPIVNEEELRVIADWLATLK
jgi:cytochrome c